MSDTSPDSSQIDPSSIAASFQRPNSEITNAPIKLKEIPDNLIESKLNNKSSFDWLNLIIQLALAIVTFLLFKQAVNQNAIAKQSMEIANTALEDSRRKDMENRISDSIRHQSDSINREKEFRLQHNSVNAQIQQLKDASNRFVIENRSFLQAVVTDSIGADTIKLRMYNYKLYNYGNYPAKIIAVKTGDTITFAQPDLEKMLNNSLSNKSLGIYVFKSNPENLGSGKPRFYTRDQVLRLYYGSAYLYLYGEIIYQDLASQKHVRKYRFLFKYNLATAQTLVIKNENID